MARHTYWVDTIITLTIANGAVSTLRLGTLDTDFIESRTATIVRTLVNFSIMSSTVAGAWGIGDQNIGIGIESEEAFGGGSHPSPGVATQHPTRGWILKTHCVTAQNGAGAPVLYKCEYDMHNMRKLDNGAVFLSITHDMILGTSFGIQVHGIVRLLVKD